MSGRVLRWIGGRSLAFQIGILFFVAVAPLLLASALVIDRLAVEGQQRVRESLMMRTKTLAALIDNEIDTHVALAWALASSPALARGDIPAFRAEAEQTAKFVPGSWVNVIDTDLQFLVSTLVAMGTPLPQHPDADIVRRGFETGKPQVADLTLGPIFKRVAPFVEMPVFREGQPAYSISVAMPPQRFRALIEQKVSGGEIVGVLDRNHRFVARIPDRFGQTASPDWLNAMRQSPEGWYEGSSLEGARTLTAYTPTARGWTVGIGAPVAELWRPVQDLLWRAVAIALSLLALSAGFAIVAALRINRGMSTLAAAAGKVGRGEVISPPEPPFAEARAIGVALADASTELKRRETLLERDKHTLEALVAQRTEELQREMATKQKVEEQLRQSQKMESLGQLAGGVAHDFNNMLAIVIGSLDLARRRLTHGNGEGAAKLVESATEGANRAAVLTSRLLAFSRQQALQPSVLDANRLVAGMSELLRRTLGETIEVETVLAGGLWRVSADPAQLESALVNLAINARDAMPEGGKLTIETANSDLDERYAAAHGDVGAGQYVLISVTDTGIGMPARVKAQAFEPFFTTKGVGKGTGLGLSQVFGFVKQSSGHVKIYSEEGHGTSVKIYLPRFLGDAHEPEADEVSDAATPRPGVKVLVVEDESAVRAMSAAALEELGYWVLEAATPAEALRSLDAHPDVALLLTDVVLPEMNGRRLAEIAVERRPGLKVLFTTGYTRNAIVHHGVVDPGVAFLPKPFTVKELSVKVQQALR